MREKIGERDFEYLRAVLNRNADVFSKDKAEIGCCNLVEHEIELEEGANPHKSEACRAEIEMLPEYDMIEPSKLPWACEVVMAKKKGAAQVLLPEGTDNKRCVPDTANKRKPLETW